MNDGSFKMAITRFLSYDSRNAAEHTNKNTLQCHCTLQFCKYFYILTYFALGTPNNCVSEVRKLRPGEAR